MSSALSATLGTYVNDFTNTAAWRVLMSAERAPETRRRRRGYVRSPRSFRYPRSLPLLGTDTLERHNNLPSVKIPGGRARRHSGQAIARRTDRETLPPDFSFDWGGTSYQEKRSGGDSGFSLALAVIMVFLILSAQYEKLSLPLSVLLALPFGTFGALAAIWLRGLTNDVYFQIGLVTLLGLAAKNAILIVEFAVLKHAEGLSPSAAAIEAARLRLRPILMTSLAFIFGVLPLAISTGAGAGARHSTGTGVMGGMLAATFLAVFFVPLFYKVVVERRLIEKRSHDELLDEVKHLRTASHQPPHTPGHPPIAMRGEDRVDIVSQ
jgi:hypothetical protein